MKKLLLQLESQALNAYRENDFITAITLYKKILKIQDDFEHGGGWFQLASCYEETGQIELALKSYQQSLKKDPDDYIKLCAYGSFLFQIKDYIGAYKIYNKIYHYEVANNIDPSNTLVAISELVKKNNILGSELL